MSIYTEIDSNKRRTNILLGGFILFAIAVATTAVYFLAELPFSTALIIGTTFSVLYSLISYYGSRSAVLMSQGAKKVNKENAWKLVTMTENICITAGIPLPDVYVINDPAPNAFATGRNPEHAVVAATEGIMNILSRDELKGVMAHEMSHVMHRDILIGSIAATIAGAIAYLAHMAQWSAMFGGFGRDGGCRSCGGNHGRLCHRCNH